MKRNPFITDPLSCDLSDHKVSPPITETAFEKRRGISSVEVRPGFTQVHVSRLEGDLMKERLALLDAVQEAGVSLDFLKLSPSGMSFLVPDNSNSLIEAALSQRNAHFSMSRERSIVLVHAVNMRDEEGMIAGIVRRAIETGIPVDHVTDMHDRMLLVMENSQASRFVALFPTEEASHA